MSRRRVLAIGLDSFDITYANELMAAGRLPVLAGRREQSAHVLLDPGASQRTGLGWEHFWSGLTPQAAHRDTPIAFDPVGYASWQEGARFDPFFSSLDVRVAVLDPPYADLPRTNNVEGIAAWGSHDPGLTKTSSVPSGLAAELASAVGPYPSAQWIYGIPWPSPDATREMGDGLVAGIAARSRAARWLLGERVTDWDLGIVVVAESHQAAEGFWHGIDPAHPLFHHPSARPAADALGAVYDAIDRLVGEVIDALEPSVVVVFSMGGMGPNQTDVQSMVLLPELVFRWALGERSLDVPAPWTAAPDQIPDPGGEKVRWDRAWYPSMAESRPAADVRHRLVDHLPRSVKDRVRTRRQVRREQTRAVGYQKLDWQPATWYESRWPEMRAFALPALYDGRVRVNLRGRESRGIVDPAEYAQVCDELEQLLRDCVDPRTGESAVALVERPGRERDPLTLDASDVDLIVTWSSSAAAFEHPEHGLIGPVPFRRTGGHTRPYGFAMVSAPHLVAGDCGMASSFDVAPTLVELLGAPPVDGISGTSLLGSMRGGVRSTSGA